MAGVLAPGTSAIAGPRLKAPDRALAPITTAMTTIPDRTPSAGPEREPRPIGRRAARPTSPLRDRAPPRSLPTGPAAPRADGRAARAGQAGLIRMRPRSSGSPGNRPDADPASSHRALSSGPPSRSAASPRARSCAAPTRSACRRRKRCIRLIGDVLRGGPRHGSPRHLPRPRVPQRAPGAGSREHA